MNFHSGRHFACFFKLQSYINFAADGKEIVFLVNAHNVQSARLEFSHSTGRDFDEAAFHGAHGHGAIGVHVGFMQFHRAAGFGGCGGQFIGFTA